MGYGLAVFKREVSPFFSRKYCAKSSAGKLVLDNEYKRLTAKYDNSGAFFRLISQVFHLVE